MVKKNQKKKSSPCYDIEEVDDKGKGFVANRQICTGELIISERASLVLEVDQINEENTVEKYEKLSKEKQNSFNDLTTKNSFLKKSDIFLNNAVNINEDQFGVFLTVSRVNHSCDPNAVWGSTDEDEVLELRAIKDISTGEEICVDYIGDKSFLMNRESRQK